MQPLRHRSALAHTRASLVAGVIALTLLAPNLNGLAGARSATAAVSSATPALTPRSGRFDAPMPAWHFQPFLTSQPAAPSAGGVMPMHFSAAGLAARRLALLGKIVAANGPPSPRRMGPAGPVSASPDTISGGSFAGAGYTGQIPPDGGLAAGPLNLVQAVNGVVDVFAKDDSAFGALLSSTSLTAFLGSPSGGITSDPQVIYDSYINRFWLSALYENDATGVSLALIAVSNDDNALDGWTTFQSNTRLDGGGDSGNWCDFTHIGIDAQALYLTCNEFNFPAGGPSPGGFQYAKIRVFMKSVFTGGGTCTGGYDYWNLRDSLFSAAMSIQPATMIGATSTAGEFLVDAHGEGGGDNTLQVYQITDPQNYCTGGKPVENDNGQSIYSFNPAPPATQPGGAPGLDSGDTRLLFAFWQSGILSTGQNTLCTTGHSCAGFIQINVAGGPGSMSMVQGWALAAPNTDYFYPGAAANSAGNMSMVYTRSSATQFAGAWQIGIPNPGTCTNCYDFETLVQSGLSSYANFGSPPGPQNRWGDYFAASPDPNGTGIWVEGESAATTSTWATGIELTYPLRVTILSPGIPVSGPGPGGFPQNYQISTSEQSHWNAVGLREGADGTVVDDNLALYGDRTFDHVLASSDEIPPYNDYVAINSHVAPSGLYFPQVTGCCPAGTYTAEWATANAVLNVTLGAQVAKVVRVYDTDLNSGTKYYLGLRPTGGIGENNANYSLTLHSAGKGNFQGRATAVADSGPTPPGQPALISYNTGSDPSQTDGVIVLNNNGGPGTYTLYRDTAQPGGGLHINGGATYTNKDAVTLNTAAGNPTPGDPVMDMAFSNDGNIFGAWQPFAGSAAYTLLPGDGVKTVYVKYRNGAGAVSAVARASITLDTTPPHTTASLAGTLLSGSTYAGPVKVTLKASDTGSGIATTVYQVDGGPVQTYSAPFTISSLGAHTVTFHSTDGAGNVEASHAKSFTIVAAPTSTATATAVPATKTPTALPTSTPTP